MATQKYADPIMIDESVIAGIKEVADLAKDLQQLFIVAKVELVDDTTLEEWGYLFYRQIHFLP